MMAEKRGAEFPYTKGSAKVELLSPASDQDNGEKLRAPEAPACVSTSVSSPHFSLLVRTGLNGHRGNTPTSELSLRGTETENETPQCVAESLAYLQQEFWGGREEAEHSLEKLTYVGRFWTQR